MSDNEADPELLALLAKSLGLDGPSPSIPTIPVLHDAQYIYDNSTDVAIDMSSTKAAASMIWQSMQEKRYSTKTWSQHDLHPKAKDASTVDFIFTMDLLNFCFWTESTTQPFAEAFAVDYRGTRWTGYWALVACLQRALEDGLAITSPELWVDEDSFPDEMLRSVFRSSTSGPMPLLDERIAILRQAGRVIIDKYGGSFVAAVENAAGSAARLVNFLVVDFPMFRDECKFQGKIVCFYKRAQILVADLWAAFEGEDYGRFEDIDQVTMFADYRIPQMLHFLGCLQYNPRLEHAVKSKQEIPSGHSWEVQIRGCTIWCVELIRKEILKKHEDAHVNAILIDFFLYDTIKERVSKEDMIPHHRTKSIWY